MEAEIQLAKVIDLSKFTEILSWSKNQIIDRFDDFIDFALGVVFHYNI